MIITEVIHQGDETDIHLHLGTNHLAQVNIEEEREKVAGTVMLNRKENESRTLRHVKDSQPMKGNL